MRENLEDNENSLKHPDAITLPQDLVNWGRRCVDCRTKGVVLENRDPGFGKVGPLCLDCLAIRCGTQKRIPYPMEEQLLDELQRRLGILPAPRKMYVIPDLGGLTDLGTLGK